MDTPILSYADTAEPADPYNAAQKLIVRLRWPILALAALLLIAGYNGRWRIGRDSALYREVGRNLAEGRGYTFRGERQRHIYPGLPYLLAGVDKAFGAQDPMRPWAAQGVMLSMALLTLAGVYLLVRAHLAEWVAVCVTFGVAVNWQFAMYAHELMSDVPFLLGVVATLLGIAWLSQAGASRRRRAVAIGLVLAGAVLAISMRPTFWALALAVAGALGVSLVRWPRMRWYLISALAALVLLVGTFLFVDPRTGAGNRFGGKYEQLVRNRLSNLGGLDWGKRADAMLCAHLPDAVFAFEVPRPLGWLFSALVIGCAVTLVRTSPLWGLYVIVTVMMTAVLGARPRYFLMILPLLLVGWALWADWLARASARMFPRIPLVSSAVLLFWLGVATIPNLVKDGQLFLQQHGYEPGKGRVAFVDSYRKGRMKQVVELSEGIRKHVPAGQRVLGIEPRITTYLSGRWVYQPEDVLGKKAKQAWKHKWRQQLAAAQIAYLVYGEPRQFQSPGKFGSKLLKYSVVAIAAGSEVDLGELSVGKVSYVTGKKLAARARARASKSAQTQPATGPAKSSVKKPPKRPKTPKTLKVPTTQRVTTRPVKGRR